MLTDVIMDLVRVRVQWNMTQDDVAQLVGCHRATITGMESGKKEPSLKTLFRWADALGYDIGIKQRG